MGLSEIWVFAVAATPVIIWLIQWVMLNPLNVKIEALVRNSENQTKVIEELRTDISEMKEVLASMKEKVSSAHKRIDGLEERIIHLEKRCEHCPARD